MRCISGSAHSASVLAPRLQEYAKETSYFASYINLTPEMNGMNIGIGPIKPWILHPERSFDGVHDSPISKFSHRTNEIFS
eukprot:365442-Chlamydomonas_euryale.AAC.22